MAPFKRDLAVASELVAFPVLLAFVKLAVLEIKVVALVALNPEHLGDCLRVGLSLRLVVDGDVTLLVSLWLIPAIEVQAKHDVDILGGHHEGSPGVQDNVALVVNFNEVETDVAIFHREVGVFKLPPRWRHWTLNLKEHLAFTGVAKSPRPDLPAVELVPG